MSATPTFPPTGTGHDDLDSGGRADARAAWVTPGIRRLRAAEAELNPVITNDSEGTVS